MMSTAQRFETRKKAEAYIKDKLVGWPEARPARITFFHGEMVWVIMAGRKFFDEKGYFVDCIGS